MRSAGAAPGHPSSVPRLCLTVTLLTGTLLTGAVACAAQPAAHPAAQPDPRPAAVPATTTTPQASPTAAGWQLSPGESLIAVAKHASVAIRTRSSGPVRWRLHNPNNSGAPLVFLVVAQQGDGWQVRVPARPNGAVGWVPDADIELQVDPFELRASLHAHTLAVYEHTRRIRVYRIGVGRPGAPTPVGRFFLTDLLEAANPHGPYGPYAYGTSAFSDVYSEFEGGPGQIGVHGTDDPSSVGRNVSHGCIRLQLRDITALAHMVPAGTPLTIVP